MKRVIIWGAGENGKNTFSYIEKYCKDSIDIIGVTDSFKNSIEWSDAARFYAPYELDICSFDTFIVACDKPYYNEIVQKIFTDFGESVGTVFFYDLIMESRRKRIINKYANSNDVEIQETVDYLKSNPLTVRNQFANKDIVKYDVVWDLECGYPYVNFFGKRMYFPKDYLKENQSCLFNIVEQDQYAGSPHLYLFDDHIVKDGDVLIDAGVCEGNFSLLHIEKLKKVYLVESDIRWRHPLELTFGPYAEKVEFVFKALSDIDSDESITIDSLLKNENSCNFLKMDIEGYESSALLGGINSLRRFHPKCSICSYHRQFDEKYIRFILESCGYTTTTSDGFFFMNYDPNIDQSLDFRRAMVYGD